MQLQKPAYQGWGSAIATLGEGYLEVEDSAHPVTSHVEGTLHFWQGLPVCSSRPFEGACMLDCHGRGVETVPLAEANYGAGRVFLIAPDVTGTIVRAQQGVAITRDGVPAPDGSAPTCDAVLKSDDGTVLDWIFDRDEVEGVPGLKAFLRPVADAWRELLLRAIFHLARESKVALPLLWLYPRDLPAIGHISLDSDHNDPDLAQAMLDCLERAQIPATWCIILPGHKQPMIDAIREGGHELAMHFDAMTPGHPWDEAAFDRQFRALCEQFGGEAPTTNKNHYLRWEGDTEFFEWCQKRGITLDQTKGASKTGEAGFNFGTCHPYFPLAPDGTPLDVLELPTPTQDLTVFVPPALVPPLLRAVLKAHGVLHLLFHPAHFNKPAVAPALEEAVALGKERGLEWWTARQLSDWERARRETIWLRHDGDSEQNCAVLRLQTALPDATLLWLASDKTGEATEGITLRVNEQNVAPEKVERWGFTFYRLPLNQGQPGDYRLVMNGKF